MRILRKRIGYRLLLALLVPAAGCTTVVNDLVNPDFLSRMGVDSSSQGSMLVVFNNQTRYTANMSAFYSSSATDLTKKSRNFSVQVPGKSNKNEVLDCPIGLVMPGTLNADFTVDSATAALVDPGGLAAAVGYDGVPLQSGMAFVCGDLVEIRLSEVAAAVSTDPNAVAESSFVISLSVIPGQ
jgi:hypothetical protein